MIPPQTEPSVSTPPNILLDRVLTATVFCLIIHSGLFYSLRVAFDLSIGWLFLCIGVGVLTYLNYRRLEWARTQKKTRFAQRLSNIWYGVIHFIVGVFLGSVALRLLDRKGYVGRKLELEKVSNAGMDERYSFVLQSSGIAATYYFVHFLSTCGYVIKFPVIETSSLIRLRGILCPTLNEAAKITGHVVVLSYLVYLIDGTLFHSVMSIILWSGASEEAGKLSSFSSYFDIELLLLTTLCQILVVFTLKTVWLTMEVLITKRVKFRVDDDIPGINSIGLREMMASSNLYIRKLAYYDLRLLAEFDEIRMRSLFTLSHPGGFPKIWNSVSRACLEQIKKMTSDLKVYVGKIDTDKRQAETKAIDEVAERLTGPRVYFMSSPSDAVTDTKIRSRFPTTAMRNLNSPFDNDSKPRVIEANGDFYSDFWDNPFAPVANLTSIFLDVAAKYLLKLLSILNLLKFFKETTDMDVASLFQEQESVLWAVFALTDIVVASKRIDSKGVVQPDVSLILTSLTDLCSALDEFKSLQDGHRVGLFVPNAGIKTTIGNTAVKVLVQGVRKPLKNEIMRIHLNFHPYYDIICIPSTCEQMLKKISYYD